MEQEGSQRDKNYKLGRSNELTEIRVSNDKFVIFLIQINSTSGL